MERDAQRAPLRSLTVRAVHGDKPALNELLQRVEVIARAYFVRRIGDRDEVNDLVQNVLLRVHRSIGDIRVPDGFTAFVLKAALFELQDYYRGRYSAREVVPDDSSTRERPGEAGKPDVRIDVEAALQQLGSKARRIIELREYGYRYEEIAEMIGSTEAAVKMQVKRAFEKLRGVLMLCWTALILAN